MLKYLLKTWSKQDFLSRPVQMHPAKATLSQMTDASQHGWCGILLPHKTLGNWDLSVPSLSKNWKELKAVQLSLREFKVHLSGKAVQLLSDNSTTVASLRHQGSVKHHHLHSQTENLLFCRNWYISLHPDHLRGVLNVLADQGSRHLPIATEWSLDWTTFAWLTTLAPTLQVDLFVTRENAQLPLIISPDHLAGGFDAFSIS